jgi:periodic tryptophan protein 2
MMQTFISTISSDVLAGHEGPVACLDFSKGGAMLASGSWDGTLKLWDVYKNSCIETMEHGCDVLAVAFRPDGKEVCTTATNGIIYFWDTESGSQISTIEGRRDISGGRLNTDARTADNSARSKYFTSVSYTADGSCIIAGGYSKYVCIYAVLTGALVKKFQMSYNRSLDGLLDELRSDRMIDGVVLDTLPDVESDDDGAGYSVLPGAQARRRGDDGTRSTKPTIHCSAVKFSPTGHEWAAATTQGIQIFSLDEDMLFAPTDLDLAITPQAVSDAITKCEFGLAINMALHLGMSDVLKMAVDSVDINDIELVIKSLDVRMVQSLIKFLADEVVKSVHLEFYLRWTLAVLKEYSSVFEKGTMQVAESMRVMIRAITVHEVQCSSLYFITVFYSEFF